MIGTVIFTVEMRSILHATRKQATKTNKNKRKQMKTNENKQNRTKIDKNY